MSNTERANDPAPERAVGKLELADILDAQAVQSLMEDFHALIPIPMAILDLKGRVLVGVGWQEICTRFHRAHPQTCQHCTESDTVLSAGVAPGNFKLYKCKNHMWDMATPILVDGHQVGNLFLGQFFFEDESLDHALFRSQARQYGFNEQDYLAALQKVPRLSRKTLDRAVAYFSKLARMLSHLSYTNLRLARSLAQRRQAEAETRRNEARLASLLKLSQFRAPSVQALLDFALHEAVALTGSQIGYIYRYDEARQEFTLNTWSKGVMEQCRVAQKQTTYQLEQTGIWGEAVRQARPIILNDFAAPNPLKKGCPEGHAPLHKFLTVPVITEGHIVGVVGVANKATDYDDSDVRQLTLLMDSVWKFVERKEAEATINRLREHAQAALKQANDELEQRVATRTAALHAAERYARSLLEASLDPLVTISHEGRITDVNQATERVTGVPRARLIGSSFSSYFTQPEQAEAGYQKVLKDGVLSDCPLTIRHLSGQTRDVLYNAAVYRNEAGEVQGVFAAARDITERKEAERRRDFTNALLALFARKTTASDYLNSVLDVIRQWTGCQALGIRLTTQSQEIPYETWAGFEPAFLEREHCLSLQHDHCLCIRAISGACEDSDRPLLTAGGSFRTDDALAFATALPPEKRALYRGTCMQFGFASLAVIPIHYCNETVGALHLADRRPGRFPLASVQFIESMTPLIGEALHRFRTEAELAKHRDHLEVLVQQRTSQLELAKARLEAEILERTRAQESLQQTAEDLKRSNGDLEQFAYVASHDLQEPLRAVGGYVKLLKRRFPEHVDPKAQEYIAGAAEGAARMERLIIDLLAFSRVGTRGQAFVPADLNELLGHALQNLRASIDASGATVTHDPLPTLAVDPTQIIQLFQNLIGNAIKFQGEQPPRVHVAARQQADRWVLSVRDNGIGIAPQYFERIFQIFQRLHTRKYYAGTGIGLAICKKIVERHGGAIWVESQPEQGSTFHFSLPKNSLAEPHPA